MEKEDSVKLRKKRKSKDDGSDRKRHTVDENLVDLQFPSQYEPDFVCAIFELGLKHSSPKVIMSVMQKHPHLNTEHIKSHLQKYRIHHERSKEEFLLFYNSYMRDAFHDWHLKRGWDSSSSSTTVDKNAVESSSSSSTITVESEKYAACQSAPSSIAAPGSTATSTSVVLLKQIEKKAKTSQANKAMLAQEAEEIIAKWRNLYEDSVPESQKLQSIMPIPSGGNQVTHVFRKLLY